MEIECCIGDLFEAIARREDAKLIIDKEYLQKSKIELQNEKSEWCNVSAVITKTDSIRDIVWSNNATLRCGGQHLLHCGSEYTRYANSFSPGDEIILANGVSTFCSSNEMSAENDIVYDLQIDTPSHLYQTANGIIHHNTLIAQTIARFLDVPFIIADATSLTESGLNAGPFIL